MSADETSLTGGKPVQDTEGAGGLAEIAAPRAGCASEGECSHQRSVKWATWAMVVIMAAGTGVGVWTANIYHRQMEVQIFKGLTDQDQAILEKARKKQHLEAFFVELPKAMDPALRADKRIRLITGGEYHARPWKDIADLGCLIYEEEDFYNPSKALLRETYGVAEDLLYLLSNVGNAYASKLLGRADYDTWIAYLGEVGDHPLFLTAIYYWHDTNYLGEELAAELQSQLCRPGHAHTRATIAALYPEMLEPDWPRRVGQGNPNCPRLEPSPNRLPSLLRLGASAPESTIKDRPASASGPIKDE